MYIRSYKTNRYHCVVDSISVLNKKDESKVSWFSYPAQENYYIPWIPHSETSMTAAQQHAAKQKSLFLNLIHAKTNFILLPHIIAGEKYQNTFIMQTERDVLSMNAFQQLHSLCRAMTLPCTTDSGKASQVLCVLFFLKACQLCWFSYFASTQHTCLFYS